MPFTGVVFESSFLLYSLAKNSFIVSLYFWKRYTMIFKIFYRIIGDNFYFQALCLCPDVRHSSILPSSQRLLSCSFSMLYSSISTHLSCKVRSGDLSLSCHTPPRPPGCLEEAQLGARCSCAGQPQQRHTQVHTHSHTVFNADWFIVSSSRSVIHILSLSCTQC